MQEALIVAVLTFVGLIAWATLINVAVKALFDYFDPADSVSRPHSNAQALAPLPAGEKLFSQQVAHAIAGGPIRGPRSGL